MSDFDLNAIRDDLTAALQTLLVDVEVVDDPRNANPPCVLVGIPGLEVSQVRTARILIPVHVLTPPPAHGDHVRWQLDQLGAVMLGVRPVVDARPGPYDIGDRTLPAYTALVERTGVFC